MKGTVIGLFTISVILSSLSAIAATYYVPDNYATIQAALDGVSSGDTIIVRDGVYKGTGNRDIDFKGEAVTLKSEHGAENCIIDCQGTELDPHRGFYFHLGETATSVVQGFTVRYGYIDAGGGIYCEGSSPTITNCIITGNTSAGTAFFDGGGGIYCFDSSSPIISDCAIKWNTAGYDGGGILFLLGCKPAVINCIVSENIAGSVGGGIRCIYSEGTADQGTIANCEINDNIAYSHGGGMDFDSQGNCTISNCEITGNSSTIYEAGGIHCYSSDIIVTDCIISGNSCNYEGGGGIWIGGNWEGIESNATVINCLISENSAGEGGGIDCSSQGIVEIEDCSIVSNTTSNRGGGIFCDFGSSPSITNCTITDNQTNYHGGAIYCDDSFAVISKCTINGNTAVEAGGGVGFAYNSPTIIDCTISGNTSLEGCGGGLFCYSSSATVKNCLMTGNISNLAGGAIYCYEYSSPNIENCTISRNTANIAAGGLFCDNESSPYVTNCILWYDSPDEIYVLSGSPTVTYSDIEGAWPGVGNINQNPLFVSGLLHDHYLSHFDIQSIQSPCIDTGSGTSASSSLAKFSTRTDHVPDTGIIDMGYHVPYSLHIYRTARAGNNVAIYWHPADGVSYVVEWSENMISWTQVSVGQVSEWTDTNASGYAKKFYRVREE